MGNYVGVYVVSFYLHLLKLPLAPEPAPYVNGASPQLLHILHPFTLDNLTESISHLVAFRAYLDTLQASRMKAAIAKDVLADVLDCSGINFKELVVALNEMKTEIKSIEGELPKFLSGWRLRSSCR